MKEYAAKRRKMIDYLGGACVKCGATENLQFDHRDSSGKTFDVSVCWSWRWERLVPELDKCQLFCAEHHLEKSREHKDLKGGQNKLTECPHGTCWGYSGPWKCRCDDCRRAKREYARKLAAR